HSRGASHFPLPLPKKIGNEQGRRHFQRDRQTQTRPAQPIAMSCPGVDPKPCQCDESNVDAALGHVPSEELNREKHGECGCPEFSSAIKRQVRLSQTMESP